ncbi:hypothetical protein Bealeia1_01030 [Candidatus Bealeia paramacronuclearis]|uniref:Uncharacterized protein n=1 Tax=Candidatus Bealeia paramacronuclearis TaxID=1921001 RepID=A0ABZ2C5W8_9PROT|nr:hypothetical protein [Candidatus Bealeia paramacronuclearis]
MNPSLKDYLSQQSPHTTEERSIILEQYKILVESINHSNSVREQSHGFWMTINTAIIAGVSYIKESHTLPLEHKTSLLWTLIGLGTIFCYFWIIFLLSIKKSINKRNEMLLGMEAYLPIKIFNYIFEPSHDNKGGSLTLKELTVPVFFLLGYVFLGISLYNFTEEIVIPSR